MKKERKNLLIKLSSMFLVFVFLLSIAISSFGAELGVDNILDDDSLEPEEKRDWYIVEIGQARDTAQVIQRRINEEIAYGGDPNKLSAETKEKLQEAINQLNDVMLKVSKFNEKYGDEYRITKENTPNYSQAVNIFEGLKEVVKNITFKDDNNSGNNDNSGNNNGGTNNGGNNNGGTNNGGNNNGGTNNGGSIQDQLDDIGDNADQSGSGTLKPEQINNPTDKEKSSTKTSPKDSTASGLIDSADQFIKNGSSGNTINMNTVSTSFTNMGGLLAGIGVAVLLIVTGVMGIKFMMANPDQRAGLQKQLVGLIIAAVVIFGAYAIWAAAVRIMLSTTG